MNPEDNEVFYREVDDELRRDQMANMWNRYGLAIIAGILLLLVAIGGGIYWKHRQAVNAGEQAEKLSALFEDIQIGKTKDAGPKLDQIAKEGNEGYRVAALLTKADIAVQSGDDAAAAATFKSIAENDDFAQPYRDLALIRQTAVEFDKLAPAKIVERLKPLAVAGNPWFGSAGEMVALAYLKENKPELAAPIFAAMAKDAALPPSLRSRAVQMAGSLGVDAIQTSELTGDAAATKEVTQ